MATGRRESKDTTSDDAARAPDPDVDAADDDAAPATTDDPDHDAASVASGTSDDDAPAASDEDEGPVASEGVVAAGDAAAAPDDETADDPDDETADDDATSASTDGDADDVAPAPDAEVDTADGDAAPAAIDEEPVASEGVAAAGEGAEAAPDFETSDGDAASASTDDDTATVDTDDAASAPTDDPDDLAAATPAELAAEVTRLRAETDALQRKLDVSTKQKQKPKRVHRPARHWGSIACVVVGGLLLPLAVIGRWTSTTLLDTETYVATVTPLAENEDIQEAVSFRVSQVLVDVIDIEELVRGDLPPAAGFIAGPIESAAQSLIDDVVEEVVSTDAFTRFWADANRIGHEGVVAILTGEGTDRIDADDGRVVLKVGPLVQNVIQRLDEILGTDLADAIPDEQLDGEFVLVDSDDLGNLQGAIRLFDDLSVLLPILVIALFAASVYLSKPRRIGFRTVGYAIVTPMVIFLLLYPWVRGQYIDGLPDDTHNPDAAAAVFDIATRFLTRDLWVMLAIGVVILFVAWLIGPTGWAGRTRAWWKALISQAGEQSADSDIGTVPKWVAANERNLLVTVFVVGLATLLLWTLPTGTVVLAVTVITVLVMGVIHVLAEIGRKADADVESETAAGDAASSLPEDQTT